MRITALLLFTLLFVPQARSSELLPPTAPPSSRLVGVILSTAQALVWDGARGAYVLVRVGDSFAGGRVVAIESQSLSVQRRGRRLAFDLNPAPSVSVTRRPQRMPAVILRAPNGSTPEVEGAAMTASAAPAVVPAASPPAAPAPALAAPAPVAVPVAVPAAPPVAPPVAAAAPTPPAAATLAAPPATVERPALQPATNAEPPAAGPSAARAGEPAAVLVISRDELDGELADFAALAEQISLVAFAQGGFQVTGLRRGSFVERLGLRKGDVILRVDGRAINGLEDASAAYAWVRQGGADHFTVDLMRQGRPLRLHFVVAGNL